MAKVDLTPAGVATVEVVKVVKSVAETLLVVVGFSAVARSNSSERLPGIKILHTETVVTDERQA